MAEIDTSLNNLWWVKKPDWAQSAPSPSVAQQAESNRNFLLRVSEFDVDKRAREAQTAGTLIANKAKAQQLDAYNEDLKTWENVLPQLNQSSSPEDLLKLGEPSFKTPHFQQQWSGLVSSRSRLFAQTTDAKMFNDFLARRGRLDDKGLAAVNELGSVRSFNDVTPEHLITMGIEEERISKAKQEAQLALRAVAPTIAAESRENVAVLRGMEAEQAKTSGAGSPAYYEDGTPIPGTVKFWTGRTWQYRSVHDSGDWKSMTLPQQISALNSLIRLNKGIAEGGFATKEEATAAKEKVKEYATKLEALLPKGTGTKAAVAPEAKAAKANALAKQHPDWSRQQIIDEVNRTAP